MLEDSVAAHLVADVPISTFLSGGLDSSLLTVLAARHNRDIDCYTISFRPEDRRLEAMPDDLAYARKLAGQHGIRLHEVEIAPDVADLLPRMVHTLDEPIGDAAAINAYLICRAAREAGVKVLLSGMGADELFGGYRKHYAGLLAARYRRLPGVLRHAGRRAGGRAAAGGRPASRLPRGALGQALRGLRGPARGGGVPPQLHPLRRRRAARAARPRALAAGRPAGRGARGRLRRGPGRRPGEPHVLHRHAAVPDRPQPGVHRPGQHGRLDRGPRPVRRQGGGGGRLRHPRPRQDRRPRAQGDPQAGGRGVAAQGDRVPPQGAVQRAAAGLDPPRPGRHGRGPGRRGDPGHLRVGGQADGADHDRRRPPRRRRPVQGDLAAADPRGLVPAAGQRPHEAGRPELPVR